MQNDRLLTGQKRMKAGVSRSNIQQIRVGEGKCKGMNQKQYYKNQ